MTLSIAALCIVIAMALVFDFVNGFHDAANVVATIVASRVLSPLHAVLLAGVANFAGYFTFGTAVAKMIGGGIVSVHSVGLLLVFTALLGAVAWNLGTWLMGLPSSSSHALIGGLLGSAVAASGFGVIIVPGIVKIVCFIFIAPVLGMAGAMVLTFVVQFLLRKTSRKTADKRLKWLQLFAALVNSVGHGTNDAQKTMGIIAIALVAGGVSKAVHIDGWVVVSCYCAISLGTMCGGWKIVKTMGVQLTKIKPLEGFSSGISSAAVLFGTAALGIPVSTTHVIAGSIMGVGMVKGAKRVRWNTARKMVVAWFLTIPVSALAAGCLYWILNHFF
ncbi:MAG TPA: inorganic phosphate transporter [Chitinivibrionales bacterium]